MPTATAKKVSSNGPALQLGRTSSPFTQGGPPTGHPAQPAPALKRKPLASESPSGSRGVTRQPDVADNAAFDGRESARLERVSSELGLLRSSVFEARSIVSGARSTVLGATVLGAQWQALPSRHWARPPVPPDTPPRATRLPAHRCGPNAPSGLQRRGVARSPLRRPHGSERLRDVRNAPAGHHAFIVPDPIFRRVSATRRTLEEHPLAQKCRTTCDALTQRTPPAGRAGTSPRAPIGPPPRSLQKAVTAHCRGWARAGPIRSLASAPRRTRASPTRPRAAQCPGADAPDPPARSHPPDTGRTLPRARARRADPRATNSQRFALKCAILRARSPGNDLDGRLG